MIASNWLKMRSDIYLRDKGICWVCNEFVDLNNYDLGHLIDRCMDGQDTYDNLAVMHKPCNLSKPKHQTLEEAIKWRLTSTIDSIRPTQHPRRPERGARLDHSRTGKKAPRQGDIQKAQLRYEEAIKRIKPATICWVQGKPQHIGNTKEQLWRLIAPPYLKADMFFMRHIPPGAIINGDTGVRDTLQSLNGILQQSIIINLGIMVYEIYPNGTNRPDLIIKQSSLSNQLVGMGCNQAPIDRWLKAKSEGISWVEFNAKLKSEGVITA